MTVRHLTSFGWCEWTSAQAWLGGARCAWQDLDGFHLTDCPDTPPSTSHLWAWDGERCLRLRVDSGQGLVVILSTAAVEPLRPDQQPQGACQVEVTVRTGTPWAAADLRIGHQDEGVLDQEYVLWEVPGENDGTGPVLFVAGRPGALS